MALGEQTEQLNPTWSWKNTDFFRTYVFSLLPGWKRSVLGSSYSSENFVFNPWVQEIDLTIGNLDEKLPYTFEQRPNGKGKPNILGYKEWQARVNWATKSSECCDFWYFSCWKVEKAWTRHWEFWRNKCLHRECQPPRNVSVIRKLASRKYPDTIYFKL